MSGETILIEQLRADVERLRDDRADLQERCNRLSAEKAEALRMLAALATLTTFHSAHGANREHVTIGVDPSPGRDARHRKW